MVRRSHSTHGGNGANGLRPGERAAELARSVRSKARWAAMPCIFGAAMLVLVVTVAPARAAVFTPETIAWWRFDPHDFLADSSGRGNVLSNSGALSDPDTACGGGSGSAYFNGSAIMQTASTLDLTPYNHIAMSWWQKVESTSVAILWEHSANYTANLGGFIGVVNEAPKYLPAYVALRGTNVNMDTFPYTNGTWQHFTAQINLGLPSNNIHEAVKIYQDGVLVGADKLAGTRAAAFLNQTFFLGARSGVAAPLVGRLDEVKIETASSYVNDVANHANLVGYWRLGESAGTTAWEVKGTVGNGTYVNTTAGDFSQPGAVNFDLDTAMRFNGASYVNAGNHASLNGAWDGLTVAAWVKPDSAALSGTSLLAGKWANSIAQDHFGLFLLNGKVMLAVGDGVVGESGLASDTVLTADEWYFVAGTWDATTRDYNLYINGELDPATRKQFGNGINTSSTTTMKIGAQVVGIPRHFAGLIDEVAVFNTALGGQELMAFYRTAMVPEPSSVLLAVMALLGLFGRRRRR